MLIISHGLIWFHISDNLLNTIVVFDLGSAFSSKYVPIHVFAVAPVTKELSLTYLWRFQYNDMLAASNQVVEPSLTDNTILFIMFVPSSVTSMYSISSCSFAEWTENCTSPPQRITPLQSICHLHHVTAITLLNADMQSILSNFISTLEPYVAQSSVNRL